MPLSTLVVSTLVANLLQPTVLAQLPPLVALALALGGPDRVALAFLALALGLLLVIAAGQATGLVLHALSRNRRLHDRAIFVGIALGVLLSLMPLLLLSRGGSAARRLLAAPLLQRDVFVLSPFAWSARAAVHASRGDGLGLRGHVCRSGDAGARGDGRASRRSWRSVSTAASSTAARRPPAARRARGCACPASSAR